MWFLNLQTFLTSPWFSLTLFILIFVLVLKIHTLQQQQIKLGSAASLKQDLLQQTIIQKGENLYQLAAAWLDVSDELQQLNYDYLNARIGCKQYAGLPQFTFVQLHREQAAAAVALVGALPIAFEPHQ